MEIQRFDKRPGCSRVVIHNHVAYFTGHVAAGKQPTLREQGEAVLKRYVSIYLEAFSNVDSCADWRFANYFHT